MTTTAEHGTDTGTHPGANGAGRGAGPGADNGTAYGRTFHHFYDRLFPKDRYADLTAQVLADWHPGGGALEFGVGTGRLAVPLAARTGPVTGVDASPEMLALLRTAAGARGVPVTAVRGDIRTYRDEHRYGLVYCVCATLAILLTPEQQRAAVARAADRLAPGGTLVVESHNPAYVHALHEGRRSTSWFTPYPEPDTGLQTYSTLVPGSPLWQAQHLWHEPGGTRVGSETSRLTTPEETDAYAAAAGLVLAGRQADWLGSPYRDDSPLYISRYVRDGRGTGGAEHDDRQRQHG